MNKNLKNFNIKIQAKGANLSDNQGDPEKTEPTHFVIKLLILTRLGFRVGDYGQGQGWGLGLV